MSSNPSANLVQLSAGHLKAATEVLTAAFITDPFMAYLFGSNLELRRQGIQELMQLTCRIRLDLGEPLIGAEVDGKLAAVACIAPPGKRDWPASLEAAWEDSKAAIGHEAATRLGQYGVLRERHELTVPHYYLVALGVHPDYKGQGLGGRLVDYAVGLSESDPESTGLGLDTENPVNLDFYHKHGLKVKASEWLDELRVFFLFRPNNATPALTGDAVE